MSYAIRFLPATDCNCGCKPELMANPAEHSRWCPYVAGMPGAAPADVSQALYLSTDQPRRLCFIHPSGRIVAYGSVPFAKVTSEAADVRVRDRATAYILVENATVRVRCARDHLVADVVTLDEALEDIAQRLVDTMPRLPIVEPREGAKPMGRTMHAAYAALGDKERAVFARYKARRAEREEHTS